MNRKPSFSKLLCWVLTIAMLGMILPQLSLPVFADDSGACGDSLYWSFSESTGALTITGSGQMWEPESMGDMPPWYSYRDQITSVSLPYGLSNICGFAFKNCGKLTSVTIPDSVTKISLEAFSNCTGLKSVTIPKNVQLIEETAFVDCTGLAGVWILNPSCKIEVSYTVMYHADMELVYFYDTFGPDSRIYGYRNSTAEQYTKANYTEDFHHDFIPIDGGYGQCGDALYWGFDNVTGTLTVAGSGDMWDFSQYDDPAPWSGFADQIKTVSLLEGLTGIGRSAFSNCGNLTSVTIPESTLFISTEAFSDCTGLTGVTIPKNVQLISEAAFYNCANLANAWILNPSCEIEVSYTEITHGDMDLVYFYDTFGPDTRIYGYRNSTAEQYTKSKYTDAFHHDFIPIDGGYGQCGDALYWGFDDTTGTLTVAGSGDMWDFSQYDDPAPWSGFAEQIKTVSLLEGLTGVGRSAFSNCGNLSSVTIPESALLISTEAFSNCTSLKSVTIPKNVQKIDELAFYNCTNLADAWILNPSCKIEVSYTVMIHADMELVYFYDTFGPDARIHGYRDSTAEAYTKANYPDGFHHEFIPIEGKPKKFADVPKDAYYADAVDWAVEKEITKGTSDTAFSPDQSCTRAQVVTFLHRAAGTEAPSGESNPFTDLIDGSYYFDAVLWAVEKGVTTGTSPTTFSPEMSCTRAQVVTFLWRAAGEPAPDSSVIPFLDVPKDAYYRTAVVWAIENGITAGTSTTTFSPEAICSRAQIVTFLYRDLA